MKSPEVHTPRVTHTIGTRARGIATTARRYIRGDHRPLGPEYLAAADGARALEIGGPSAVFASGGLVPVYERAASVDNVQFTAITRWHRLDSASDVFEYRDVDLGRQIFSDDPRLPGLESGSYDLILSSHVIEHFANPGRALQTWRRLATPGGSLLMIAPHHEGTFDRRRPPTPLSHLKEDLHSDTTEDDLTHLQETIDLHDFQRDVVTSYPVWLEERQNNFATRVIHHHVFNTHSLVDFLEFMGVRVIQAEARLPHDIYVLGRFPDANCEPSSFQRARIDPGPFSR